MEYIIYISKITSIYLMLFISCIKCYTQQTQFPDDFIYGKWKSIKHDYRGYQKYTFEQAEKIRHSTLTIEKKRFYYSNIDFIEPCMYSRLNISKFDTSAYYGYSIEFVYSKKELADIVAFTPVDDKGNSTCFNECAILLLKQDTLINICGGYTFYLIKEK